MIFFLILPCGVISWLLMILEDVDSGALLPPVWPTAVDGKAIASSSPSTGHPSYLLMEPFTRWESFNLRPSPHAALPPLSSRATETSSVHGLPLNPSSHLPSSSHSSCRTSGDAAAICSRSITGCARHINIVHPTSTPHPHTHQHLPTFSLCAVLDKDKPLDDDCLPRLPHLATQADLSLLRPSLINIGGRFVLWGRVSRVGDGGEMQRTFQRVSHLGCDMRGKWP